MERPTDAFRTISEVAEDLDLPQHVLRFWETRFSQIKPMKRGGGRRYYRPDDVELLRAIRHLLYGEGYTIRGVQRILKEQGAKAVVALVREGAVRPPVVPAQPAARVEPVLSADDEVFAEEDWSQKLADARRTGADVFVMGDDWAGKFDFMAEHCHVVYLARTPEAVPAQQHRRTVLTGRWLGEHTVFLENRQMEGRPGFFVLTPLELAPGDAVLVQRGWVPRDPRDRTRVPAVPTPGEPAVQVAGVLMPPPARLYDFGDGGSGAVRQNLDLTAYAQEIGVALRPWSLQQQAEGAPDDGLARRWPAQTLDIHKHHGYAFQWFALAALLTGLYVWFQLLGPWRERRRAARG